MDNGAAKCGGDTGKISKYMYSPVHVIKKRAASSDQANCELNDCIENARPSARDNQLTFECKHPQSVQNRLPLATSRR